jgi:hypothetical protein
VAGFTAVDKHYTVDRESILLRVGSQRSLQRGFEVNSGQGEVPYFILRTRSDDSPSVLRAILVVVGSKMAPLRDLLQQAIENRAVLIAPY